MKLSLEQKKSLSNYSGNLSIAWFAAGIIGPIVTKQNINEVGSVIVLSSSIATILFIFMVIFVKEERRKRK